MHLIMLPQNILELLPVIKMFNNSNHFDLKVFVGGTHLADEYGKTISEIESKGIYIADTFDYLPNENSSFSLSNS